MPLQVERKRRYRVLHAVTVRPDGPDGDAYEYGDEFEHQFDAEEEWQNIASGLLGLVAEWYQVIGTSEIEINMAEVPSSLTTRLVVPGETFQALIPLAREDQMRFHIRHVKPPADPASSKE